MAEYHMTYSELKDFIDICIKGSENQNTLSEYKAEILAALTVNVNNDNSIEAKDILSLWENQIGTPSELLLGTRYICIKDSMITFIKGAFSSGLVDTLISDTPASAITVGVASGVVFSLIELFTKVNSLNDLDFCIFMQAVHHFKKHKYFTKDDLLDWFPHGGNLICNMHNSKWDCEFLENDKCSIIQDNGIEQALGSLIEKNLLTKEHLEKKDFYKFKF